MRRFATLLPALIALALLVDTGMAREVADEGAKALGFAAGLAYSVEVPWAEGPGGD